MEPCILVTLGLLLRRIISVISVSVMKQLCSWFRARLKVVLKDVLEAKICAQGLPVLGTFLCTILFVSKAKLAC